MRTCNCVGYLTNPGGRCCMDLQDAGSWTYRKTTIRTITTDNTQPLADPTDEQRVREIVREEIADLPIPFDVADAPPEN